MLLARGKKSAGPTVVAYLHEQAVDDIDILIASHADSHHLGGLIDVLEAPEIILIKPVVFSNVLFLIINL